MVFKDLFCNYLNANGLAKAFSIVGLRTTLLWLSVDEGISRKMIQTIQRQIYVQIGPAQMESVNQLNVMDLLDSGFLKPGEIFIGQEILRVINQKPYAAGGNLDDFSAWNAFSMIFQFHLYAPRSFLECLLTALC